LREVPPQASSEAAPTPIEENMKALNADFKFHHTYESELNNKDRMHPVTYRLHNKPLQIETEHGKFLTSKTWEVNRPGYKLIGYTDLATGTRRSTDLRDCKIACEEEPSEEACSAVAAPEEAPKEAATQEAAPEGPKQSSTSSMSALSPGSVAEEAKPDEAAAEKPAHEEPEEEEEDGAEEELEEEKEDGAQEESEEEEEDAAEKPEESSEEEEEDIAAEEAKPEEEAPTEKPAHEEPEEEEEDGAEEESEEEEEDAAEKPEEGSEEEEEDEEEGEKEDKDEQAAEAAPDKESPIHLEAAFQDFCAIPPIHLEAAFQIPAQEATPAAGQQQQPAQEATPAAGQQQQQPAQEATPAAGQQQQQPSQKRSLAEADLIHRVMSDATLTPEQQERVVDNLKAMDGIGFCREKGRITQGDIVQDVEWLVLEEAFLVEVSKGKNAGKHLTSRVTACGAFGDRYTWCLADETGKVVVASHVHDKITKITDEEDLAPFAAKLWEETMSRLKENEHGYRAGVEKLDWPARIQADDKMIRAVRKFAAGADECDLLHLKINELKKQMQQEQEKMTEQREIFMQCARDPNRYMDIKAYMQRE
jgi:hypothetical protein